MKHSDSIAELTASLVSIQADLPVIEKSHKARVQTKNGGEYTYQYADLEDVQTATLPLLKDAGLAIVQTPSWNGTADLLCTRLMHVSGEWLEDTMRLPDAGSTPQGQGSGITYARRYAWCAILGLRSDKDDDGQGAQDRGGERSQPGQNGSSSNANTGRAASGPRGGRASASRSGSPGYRRQTGAANPRPATPGQHKALYAISRSKDFDLAAFIEAQFPGKTEDDLTSTEAGQLIEDLNKGAVDPHAVIGVGMVEDGFPEGDYDDEEPF